MSTKKPKSKISSGDVYGLNGSDDMDCHVITLELLDGIKLLSCAWSDGSVSVFGGAGSLEAHMKASNYVYKGKCDGFKTESKEEDPETPERAPKRGEVWGKYDGDPYSVVFCKPDGTDGLIYMYADGSGNHFRPELLERNGVLYGYKYIR